MAIVLTAVGIVLVLAGFLIYAYQKSEKCKHTWTKISSTNTSKEYTFIYQCDKCKEKRSETYIIF